MLQHTQVWHMLNDKLLWPQYPSILFIFTYHNDLKILWRTTSMDKRLEGYKLEWIYGLLGMLQHSPRVNERAIKLFLIMAHLSYNKSIFYKVAVEKIHCLHFCDSVKSDNPWLHGQLAQTGHMHTPTLTRETSHYKLPTGSYTGVTTKPHLGIIWVSAR